MEARPHTLYMDAFIGLETIDGDASVNLRSQLPFSVQYLGSLNLHEGLVINPIDEGMISPISAFLHWVDTFDALLYK